MKIGLRLPQVGPHATRDLVLRFAETAEHAGYDSLWTIDHVVRPRAYSSRYPYAANGRSTADPTDPLLESLTLLAFVAAVTQRIELGTSVLVLPMRQPVLHAKIIASLDHLAGGRFILGAGLGWAREEF